MPSSFTENLKIEYDAEIDRFVTLREFTYYVGHENSDDHITVPLGFPTDFASVPPIARWIIPRSGKYNQAAVVHDYLYTYQTRSRKESDRIFLEAMEVLGVPLWKRRTMYRAVRMFGWYPWNKIKKEKSKK